MTNEQTDADEDLAMQLKATLEAYAIFLFFSTVSVHIPAFLSHISAWMRERRPHLSFSKTGVLFLLVRPDQTHTGPQQHQLMIFSIHKTVGILL